MIYIVIWKDLFKEELIDKDSYNKLLLKWIYRSRLNNRGLSMLEMSCTRRSRSSLNRKKRLFEVSKIRLENCQSIKQMSISRCWIKIEWSRDWSDSNCDWKHYKTKGRLELKCLRWNHRLWNQYVIRRETNIESFWMIK